jgi:multicomponent Na+:H+ antiporter subunit A
VWAGPDPMAPLRRGVDRQRVEAANTNRVWLSAGRTLAPQRRSVVFEVVVRLLFHTMIVYSAFLLFSGHNAPGGGFAAGLVTGIALIVRYLAGGRYELGEAAPVQPGALLGSGLFLSAGVGLVAMLAGGSVLQSWIIDVHVPLIGDVHLVTSLFFDVGVYLVVVGLVLDILRSLGAEVDRRAETGEDEPFRDAERADIGLAELGPDTVPAARARQGGAP